jgi:hypothetical protein
MLVHTNCKSGPGRQNSAEILADAQSAIYQPDSIVGLSTRPYAPATPATVSNRPERGRRPARLLRGPAYVRAAAGGHARRAHEPCRALRGVAGRTSGRRHVRCSLPARLAGRLPAGACFQAGAMDGRWSGGHTPASAAASNLNN